MTNSNNTRLVKYLNNNKQNQFLYEAKVELLISLETAICLLQRKSERLLPKKGVITNINQQAYTKIILINLVN